MTLSDLPGSTAGRTYVCDSGGSIETSCSTYIQLDPDQLRAAVDATNNKHGAGTLTYKEAVAYTLIHELQHHGLHPRDGHDGVSATDPAIMGFPIGASTARIFEDIFNYEHPWAVLGKGQVPGPRAPQDRPACIR